MEERNLKIYWKEEMRMTNKDKYVKSIDKLKADEYLKQKVMKQIEASPRKAPYLKLANAMLIVILAISCTIIMQEKKQILIKVIINDFYRF